LASGSPAHVAVPCEWSARGGRLRRDGRWLGRLLVEDFDDDIAIYGREENLAPYEEVLAATPG
jgi:hypothetical protein